MARSFRTSRHNFQLICFGIEDDQALTGIDSTILDLSGQKARILRQGAISREEIQKAIPEIEFEVVL